MYSILIVWEMENVLNLNLYIDILLQTDNLQMPVKEAIWRGWQKGS